MDTTYADGRALIDYLSNKGEVSLAQLYEDSLRKLLLLAAASLFEQVIMDALHGYCDKKTGSDACILSMVRIKVIKRQYFTYFDWDNRKANPFFALLGDTVGEQLKADSKADPMKQYMESFLEIGYLRNCMVHQNFASFSFDKTSAEVYELYKGALNFVDKVRAALS